MKLPPAAQAALRSLLDAGVKAGVRAGTSALQTALGEMQAAIKANNGDVQALARIDPKRLGLTAAGVALREGVGSVLEDVEGAATKTAESARKGRAKVVGRSTTPATAAKPKKVKMRADVINIRGEKICGSCYPHPAHPGVCEFCICGANVIDVEGREVK